MGIIYVDEKSGIPLLGGIYFGIIDRGTNLLQVRAVSSCNLNCIFCSVDSGPESKRRKNNYVVEREYLVKWIKKIIEYKNCKDIEIHLDSVGEPMMYSEMAELVSDLRKIKEIKTISMQSNGTLFNEKNINALSEAGVDRINMSLNSLDGEKAKMISGCSSYDIEKVKKSMELIMKSRIQLLIAPVYMPGINDEDIPKIIQFGLSLEREGKKILFGIQKFLKYKHGRVPKGVKEQSWWQFYNKSIKEWEKRFNIKLRLDPVKDFKIIKCKSEPLVFKKDEIIEAEIVGDGWIKNEKIGVSHGRIVTILDSNKESGKIKVKIVSNKHGIYLGKSMTAH